MSGIHLQIDGEEVGATEGMTLLEAARNTGISIPTLCHHEDLEPFGACRLCIVEVEVRGWTRLVVACVYLVADGLVVRTRSEKIDRIRKTLLELLLAHAMGCTKIELYTRYEAEPTDEQRGVFRELVKQAAEHVPIAYLLGYREFC